jgi:hypothetical protein
LAERLSDSGGKEAYEPAPTAIGCWAYAIEAKRRIEKKRILRIVGVIRRI